MTVPADAPPLCPAYANDDNLNHLIVVTSFTSLTCAIFETRSVLCGTMSIPQHYLLIDDSPTDQLLAQEAFAQLQPRSTLTCVSSGREALELLESGFSLPDVILLDINMPEMNGLQLLKLLKDQMPLKAIPVVMLSISGAEDDIQQAYRLHASSYLVKSKGFDAFLEQVKSFLRYWQANQGGGASAGR